MVDIIITGDAGTGMVVMTSELEGYLKWEAV